MSTRAVFTFHEAGVKRKYHVYKHYDGYLEGAAEALKNALPFAWDLPRYEADEFTAAFIAGNKKDKGDIRYSHGPKYHGDLSFTYDIWQNEEGVMLIDARKIIYDEITDKTKSVRLFFFTFDEFFKQYLK